MSGCNMIDGRWQCHIVIVGMISRIVGIFSTVTPTYGCTVERVSIYRKQTIRTYRWGLIGEVTQVRRELGSLEHERGLNGQRKAQVQA